MTDVVNNRERGRFEVALPDGSVAFADYRLIDGKIMFPHTVIPRAHEGKGIASALARASFAWAREEGLAVIPQCSFYVTYMRRHPETHDLIDPGFATLLKA
jgi:uncharacterized protein